MDTSLCGWSVAFISGAIILSLFDRYMYQLTEKTQDNEVISGEEET